MQIASDVTDTFTDTGGLSVEEKELDCLRALRLTNPVDDRAEISTNKGRVIAGTFDWIISHSRY